MPVWAYIFPLKPAKSHHAMVSWICNVDMTTGHNASLNWRTPVTSISLVTKKEILEFYKCCIFGHATHWLRSIDVFDPGFSL